jgi:hypothetical protein
MLPEFVKIFVLFFVFNFCILHERTNVLLLLTSVLFTFSIYLVIPTMKNYKEGYEDYKVKVNGVSHLVKLLEEMFKEHKKKQIVNVNTTL